MTSVGNATTVTNSAVIAKVLTGYTSGAGTVSASDSILGAIQKLNGEPSGTGIDPNTGRPETLAQYESRTRDPDTGAVLTTGSIRGLPDILTPGSKMKTVPTNPTAEKLITERAKLQQVREHYLGQVAKSALGEAGLVQQPVASGPKVYTPQEAALLPQGTQFLGTDGQLHIRK